MDTRDIEYEADGRTMVGYLATPDGDGKRPGVLVCHEGNGLADPIRRRARMLAELGYVAFALDYHGGGKLIEGGLDKVRERLTPMMGDPPRIRAIGQAGLDVLTAQPQTDTSRLAAIGYCFGGTMSLELARGGVPLSCVVGFHSGLQTARPEDAKNITAKVLVCIGTEDPLIPAEQRTAFEAEMRAGGVDWRMNLYGGAVHSFTNPDVDALGMPTALKYDATADQRSWRAMRDLFDEVWAS